MCQDYHPGSNINYDHLNSRGALYDDCDSAQNHAYHDVDHDGSYFTDCVVAYRRGLPVADYSALRRDGLLR
jgi:hypothetical protein